MCIVSPRLASFKQALGSNEPVTEWDDADTALRAALYHLRHLSQAWKVVLSRAVYHMSMGNLVDIMFQLFLDAVLGAENISEPAGRFVHSLLLDATKGTAEVFLVEVERKSDETTMNYSTLFNKAQVVGQFMSMSLDNIERGLEDGVFRSLNAKELVHLISASFADSSKRTALLMEIR